MYKISGSGGSLERMIKVPKKSTSALTFYYKIVIAPSSSVATKRRNEVRNINVSVFWMDVVSLLAKICTFLKRELGHKRDEIGRKNIDRPNMAVLYSLFFFREYMLCATGIAQ